MICCEKCFKDLEVIDIIKSLNLKGNCEVCGNKSVFIYDTEKNNDLEVHFNELLDIYTYDDNLPPDFPDEKSTTIKEELYNNWDIFNVKPDKIHRIITNICKEKYIENPKFFKYPVGILQLIQEKYLKENCILKNYCWEDFVQAIKTESRFHTEYINKEVLKEYFKYMYKTIKADSVYYRARICDEGCIENGFSKDEMGAPPNGLAKGGRANPNGISYLYVANKPKVTLYEIRAGIYDYVTIGEFKVIEDIEVIDFEVIEKISPFLDDVDCLKLRINREVLRKISEEISRPLGSNIRNELDYLPTQYICDFIKSLNRWAGIKYKSTLCENYGYNLAVFDERLCKCVGTSVKNIEKLEYPNVEL